MHPAFATARVTGASLSKDRCVRVSLYNTTTERPRDRGVRASLSVASLGREHIGCVARRELGDKECFRPVRRRARPARPSPGIDACVPHYNISGKTAVRDGGAALRTQQRGQGILPSDRTDQPFGTSILPRGAWRRWSVANAHRSKSSDEDIATRCNKRWPTHQISDADQVAKAVSQSGHIAS